jgi:hypothetical protein
LGGGIKRKEGSMWVSKKKLKEIEDKYEEKLKDFRVEIYKWCVNEQENFKAHKAKTIAWEDQHTAFAKEHHALVEKFLETMVKALERK